MRTVTAIALCAVLFFGAFAGASAGPADTKISEITIPGAPDHGIFDPSIASSGAGKFYMSLSGVTSTVPGGGFTTLGVRTYLAVSGDQGKSWQLSGVINPDVDVQLDRKPHRGRWQSEVSALVFDQQAPKQARWKLVWHQYLNIDGDREIKHGWIAYKEAATPEGLAAAKPVKLFTASIYDDVNDNPAGWTHSPLPGPGVNKVQKLASALEHCAALSEPGLLAKPDALYLSLICFKPKLLGLLGATNHVILLKCARPCDAAAPGAWSYAGTALSQDDAESLDIKKFSATDLFSDGGRDFITVSPVGKVPSEEAYKGCVVFRFADLAAGKVERGSGGRPVPAAAASMNKDSFNGACTFLPSGANRGLLIGRADFMVRDNKPDAAFHIFRTNIAP